MSVTKEEQIADLKEEVNKVAFENGELKASQTPKSVKQNITINASSWETVTGQQYIAKFYLFILRNGIMDCIYCIINALIHRLNSSGHIHLPL